MRLLAYNDSNEILFELTRIESITMDMDRIGDFAPLAPTLKVTRGHRSATIAMFDESLADGIFSGYWVVPAGFLSDILPGVGATLARVEHDVDFSQDLAFPGFDLQP